MSIETLKLYNQLYTNTERKQLIADMITEFRKLYKYQKRSCGADRNKTANIRRIRKWQE